MRFRTRLACLAFAFTSMDPAFASSATEDDTFSPTLINGRPAMLGEYPEIVYISTANARCTATVIGSSVILTAAHCVKDQDRIGPVLRSMSTHDKSVEFVVDQMVYTAQCSQSPLYRDNTGDHDMALCKTDRPLLVKPATVSKYGPQIGASVILTGYGCILPGGTGGNDGILRVGRSQVTKLPEGTDYWFYTRYNAAICFGDSGGPALLDTPRHLVIGVNSRGNIQDESLLTALFTETSLQFMRSFARDQKVDICGVTKRC